MKKPREEILNGLRLQARESIRAVAVQAERWEVVLGKFRILRVYFVHACQGSKQGLRTFFTTHMDYNQVRLQVQTGPEVELYPNCEQCVVRVPRAVLEEAVAVWRLEECE